MTQKQEVDVGELQNLPLTDKDKWLTYDVRSNKERGPRNEHGELVSWKDPDNLLSFNKAAVAGQQNPSYGIGYVFSAGTDDLPGNYAAIDVDGCLEPKKDWLPDITPLLDEDAYIEKSPSGTGLRIPLKDYTPPEWWTDVHKSAEDHEGLEVLADSFASLTGNKIRHPDGTPGYNLDVDHDVIDEWLKQAYINLEGEDPTVSQNTELSADNFDSSRSSGDPNRDKTTDPEDVYAALREITPQDVTLKSKRNGENAGWPAYDPHYRSSDSGQSLVYNNGAWHDFANDESFGTFQLWACEQGFIAHPWDNLSGDTFQNAVDELRTQHTDLVPELVGDDLSDGQKADIDRETSGKTAWVVWKEDRLQNKDSARQKVPEKALWWIAKEHTSYPDTVLETVEKLPLAAHNYALSWIKNTWWEDHQDQYDPEEHAAVEQTWKGYSDGHIETWEDIKHIYETMDKKDGRQATADYFRDNWEFIRLETSGDRPDKAPLLIYNEEKGVWEEHAESFIYKQMEEHLDRHHSQTEQNEVINKIRARPSEDRLTEIPTDALEAGYYSNDLICVKNGVLDVQEGELKAHDPDYYFRRQVPVKYDPDPDTDPWDNYVSELVERQADKKTLEEIVGNALLPDYRHNYILFIHGSGQDGKSTFLEAIEHTLGHDNVSNVTVQELANERFKTIELMGKFANIAPDLPDTKLDQLGDLKSLSGDDTVNAERKFDDPVEFRNRAQLIFAANQLPAIEDSDRAIKRRLVPVKFPYKFTRQDDGHKDKIPKQELRELIESDEFQKALLKRAVEGARRLAENDDVSLPEDLNERYEMYQRASDPLRAFIGDGLTEDMESEEAKEHVYNAYTRFADEMGKKAVSKQMFWNEVYKSPLPVTSNDQIRRRDNGERKMWVRNIALTEEGRRYNPHHTDDNDDSDDSDDSPDDPESLEHKINDIADIDPDRNFATVQGELSITDNDGFSRGDKGPYFTTTLSDDTGEATLVVWEKEAMPDFLVNEFEHDHTATFKDVQVGEYNDELQLTITVGTDCHYRSSTRKPLEEVDSNTETPTPDGDETGEHPSDLDNVEGLEGNIAKAFELNGNEKMDVTKVVAKTCELTDHVPGTVKDKIDAMVEEGKLVKSSGKVTPIFESG